MATYYFYLIRCADNSLYAGITADLARRLLEHNSQSAKGSKYVRSRQPARLVYQEKFSSKSEALKRESEVKKWTKQEKEAFISKEHAPS
ncbi:GIY-YIG nuclease family protein [Candidatus Woesebacteria bacterium]|nr:GIY-YIG nuclease family protein [Candidatus Woesebacteria bacterium]